MNKNEDLRPMFDECLEMSIEIQRLEEEIERLQEKCGELEEKRENCRFVKSLMIVYVDDEGTMVRDTKTNRKKIGEAVRLSKRSYDTVNIINESEDVVLFDTFVDAMSDKDKNAGFANVESINAVLKKILGKKKYDALHKTKKNK